MDAQLCDDASEHGLVLASKDDDFQSLLTARDYHPKLIRLAMGNTTNDPVLRALLAAADDLESALTQSGIGIVIIDGLAESGARD
jgi:hypothetical protein